MTREEQPVHRCEDCDREDCPLLHETPAARARAVAGVREDREPRLHYAAEDCKCHAVDWRARALAADAEHAREVARLTASAVKREGLIEKYRTEIGGHFEALARERADHARRLAEAVAAERERWMVIVSGIAEEAERIEAESASLGDPRAAAVGKHLARADGMLVQQHWWRQLTAERLAKLARAAIRVASPDAAQAPPPPEEG